MHKRVKNMFSPSAAIQIGHAHAAMVARIPLQPSIEYLHCSILQKGGAHETIQAYTPRLYTFLHQIGLDAHITIGSSLTAVLLESGDMYNACEVLERSTNPDEYCWNSLIVHLVKYGDSQCALRLYHAMQAVRPHCNGFAFVALLKACTELNDTATGHQLHIEISQSGLLKKDAFVGNALVDMYAKFGLLVKARKVFDMLPHKDVVSWTSMIAGYSKHERGEEALDCYRQMQLEGVSPNAVTYVCSLKACGITGSLDQGYDIHFEVSRKGLFEKNLLVGSALVDMYAKCGTLAKAQEVFDNLPARDTVAWNALIAGYAKYEHGKEALICYKQMQLDGFSADAATFVSTLKACGSVGAIDMGKEIHNEVAKQGMLKREAAVGNALVDMYAKCGLLPKAQEVFDKLPSKNEVSWNALIAGYTKNEDYKKAVHCINQMQLEGFAPSDVTLVFFLKACGNLNDMHKVEELYAEIAQKGSVIDNHAIGSTLVDVYAKCGWLVKAQEVFEKLVVRNVILWTSLIAGYAQHEHAKQALNCLEKMQLEGVSPNAVTYACGLRACSTVGATEKGRELHAEIARNGFFGGDLIIGNMLVDMYAKGGLIAKAQEVFDKLSMRDIFSWNALIGGYVQLGDSGVVLQAFERLKLDGQKPDLTTFINLLTACNATAMLDMGQIFLEAMHKDYGIIPTIEHHTCMVDLFSRAGQLDRAVAMVKRMPLDPDLVVWRSVLDACQKWGNLELGRSAFEHTVSLWAPMSFGSASIKH